MSYGLKRAFGFLSLFLYMQNPCFAVLSDVLEPDSPQTSIPRSSVTTGEPLLAPMPGCLVDIFVHHNQEVETGDGLFILEAMKMQVLITSPRKAVIGPLHFAKGDIVSHGDILALLMPEPSQDQPQNPLPPVDGSDGYEDQNPTSAPHLNDDLEEATNPVEDTAPPPQEQPQNPTPPVDGSDGYEGQNPTSAPHSNNDKEESTDPVEDTPPQSLEEILSPATSTSTSERFVTIPSTPENDVLPPLARETSLPNLSKPENIPLGNNESSILLLPTTNTSTDISLHTPGAPDQEVVTKVLTDDFLSILRLKPIVLTILTVLKGSKAATFFTQLKELYVNTEHIAFPLENNLRSPLASHPMKKDLTHELNPRISSKPTAKVARVQPEESHLYSAHLPWYLGLLWIVSILFYRPVPVTPYRVSFTWRNQMAINTNLPINDSKAA